MARTVYPVPAGTNPSPCKGCRADIYFVPNPKRPGQLHPVDCSASAGGQPPVGDVDGHGVSHFLTCPEAAAFFHRRSQR